jgi:hypothetical protein
VRALCAHVFSLAYPVCKRAERFLPELFVFVAVTGVLAENNLAERSVRPLVIAHKISGGIRSPKGSHTLWGSPVSLAPEWHSTLILSTNVWLTSP